MNWYKIAKNKFSTYSNELGNLKSILEHGYSPYDYSYFVKKFLDENPEEKRPTIEYDEYEPYIYGEDWIENVADEYALDRFEQYTDWVHTDDPASDEPYKYIELNEVMKPTWQIHFTDDPWLITHDGFTKGHPQVEGVHLTTHFKNRGAGPGFNFGYNADYRVPNKSYYGKHAVVFYAGGLDTHHIGDQECQTIFWGPYVDKRMIFPIYHDGGEWIVEAENGREVYRTDDVNNAVSYIKDNWKMLYDIRSKEQNRKIQNRRSNR